MIDTIQDINRFSSGELRVVHENQHGAIAYNYPHQRQELVFPTRDLGEAAEKSRMGWEIKPGKEGYLLRAPEEWLVDLSDPFKAQYGSPDNLTTYRTLMDLRAKGELPNILEQAKAGVDGIDVYLLDGIALETEMRIAGSDSRISAIKKCVLNLVKSRPEWSEQNERTTKKLPKTRRLGARKYPASELSPLALQFYRSIEEVHKVIAPLYKPDCVINGFWDQIPEADVYIFIPKSGIKMALGFVDWRQRYDDIMFWEYHAGQTMSYEGQMFPKPIEGRKVAVIDVSYSGTTLNQLHRKVSDEGGLPIRVALFPKSRRSVTSSEYFIFLDRLLRSQNIDLCNEWAERLYVDTVKC